MRWWCLLVLAVVLCGSSAAAAEGLALGAWAPGKPPLHVGIICIPLHGHFKPLQVIGEEFARRGHHVTYFIENPNWCEMVRQAGGAVDCVALPPRGVFSASFFAKISRMETILPAFEDIFNESVRHHEVHLDDYLRAAKEVHARHPLSMVLGDVSTFAGGSVAAALRIPLVLLFPLTTMLPLGVSSHLPMMGTGWPARMDTWRRLMNYVLKSAVVAFPQSLERLNAGRARHGIPPLHNGYELGGWYDTVLAPTVWGFDIPHELCPNFHPLGLLNFPEDRTPPLEADLAEFLDDQCKAHGAVYVNFGTLAVPQRSHLDHVAKALEQLPFCVVWKLKEEQKNFVMQKYFGGSAKRTYIRPYFNSPFKIMRHTRVVAFVSHCGDASVHEALEAQLPIVGIPFLADQADVCQRVEEAGIGKYIGRKSHFTSDDLSGAIRLVTQASRRKQLLGNMARLLQVSKFLGGAKRAVDILQDRWYNHLLGRNTSLENCVIFNDGLESELHPLRAGQFDIFALWFLAALVLWLLAFASAEKLMAHVGRVLRKCATRPAKKRPHFVALARATQSEKEE